MHEKISTPWKPKFLKNTNTCNKNKNYGIKIWYQCGDTSYEISDYTFRENTKRVDNIHIGNIKWLKKLILWIVSLLIVITFLMLNP